MQLPAKYEFKNKRVYLVFGVLFLFIAAVISPLAGFMAACGCGLILRYVIEKYSITSLAAQQEVIRTMLTENKQGGQNEN
jgi:hypothetical protein